MFELFIFFFNNEYILNKFFFFSFGLDIVFVDKSLENYLLIFLVCVWLNFNGFGILFWEGFFLNFIFIYLKLYLKFIYSVLDVNFFYLFKWYVYY